MLLAHSRASEEPRVSELLVHLPARAPTGQLFGVRAWVLRMAPALLSVNGADAETVGP